VNGVLTVANTGSANATIGNIVVNLQKPRTGGNSGPCRNVAWVSAAADVADATNGDAATVARVAAAGSSESENCNQSLTRNYTQWGQQGTFAETPGISGSLEFTDAATNTAFSLVPQVSLAPGQSITLLYRASFDNSLLGLAPGTQVRAEALVTFGNAGARGGSGATANNIDINGNGTQDPDESSVRTVPCRVTKAVPQLIAGNDTVVLRDVASDVVVTPDNVTLGAFSTNIGPADTGAGETISTTTTRSASVVETCEPPGSAVITDTAHLDGATSTVTVRGPQIGTDPITGAPLYQDFVFTCVQGIDLDAPSPVAVTCGADDPPAPNACTFTKGGFAATCRTNNPGCLIDQSFASYFPAGLDIGLADAGGPLHDALWSASDSGEAALKTYLTSPAGGSSSALTADTQNASSTAGGNLARQTATLTLNVGFAISSSNFPSLPPTFAPDDSGLGSFSFCNLVEGSLIGAHVLDAAQAAELNGTTIFEVLADANTTLGSGNVCASDRTTACDPNSTPAQLRETCGTETSCTPAFLPAYVGTASDLNEIVDALNKSYDNCIQSAFASLYLCAPPP
jgi:hypothetical protein